MKQWQGKLFLIQVSSYGFLCKARNEDFGVEAAFLFFEKMEGKVNSRKPSGGIPPLGFPGKACLRSSRHASTEWTELERIMGLAAEAYALEAEHKMGGMLRQTERQK